MNANAFSGVFKAFVDLELQEWFGKPSEAQGIGKDVE